jgi:hypothetical protein
MRTLPLTKTIGIQPLHLSSGDPIMKLRLSLTLQWSITVAACGGPPPAAPTTAPGIQTTNAPVTQSPTTLPPATTSAPAATKPAPTEPPPAPTDTTAPQPTVAPAATKPRLTPTSAGPLSVAIYAANCRSAPTSEKPGRIIVQISVEASGGNGRYRYFYQNQESPTKFIEVIGEKGTRSIGGVRITAGDGQEIRKEFDIAANQLACP